MRERLEAYAPQLAWLGLLLIVAGLLLPFFTRQSSVSLPTWLPWALGIVGALLVLVWPMVRPSEFRAALGGRRARFGGNALILAVSVLGVLAIANYLGTRRYQIWDLTANKQFSISRQTIQILDDLADRGEKLTLTAIVPSNDMQTSADLTKLIDRYRPHASNVVFEQIDPQLDATRLIALAQRIDMADAPPSRALVAEMGDRHEIVYSGFDEQAVTEAIVKVMQERKRRVGFTTGHDEYDTEGFGERSVSTLKQQLEKEGYEVAELNLATITETLTADTFDAVVVAGPRRPFLPQEARTLAGYMVGGGALLVMIDPTVDANLSAVLVPWEIRPHDDLVLQPQQLGLASDVIVQGDAIKFHTITKEQQTTTAIMPAVRSLGIGTPVTASLQTTPLIEVGGNGEWGETDLQDQNAAKGDQDTQPPLVLAVAGEDTGATTTDGGPTPEPGKGYGRLVVFGSSSFASDAILQQLRGLSNADLFLNSVGWLTQEEALISIRPTSPDDRPIRRPTNPLLVLLATAVLAPLAVLAVGTWVYWRRR